MKSVLSQSPRRLSSSITEPTWLSACQTEPSYSSLYSSRSAVSAAMWRSCSAVLSVVPSGWFLSKSTFVSGR